LNFSSLLFIFTKIAKYIITETNEGTKMYLKNNDRMKRKSKSSIRPPYFFLMLALMIILILSSMVFISCGKNEEQNTGSTTGTEVQNSGQSGDTSQSDQDGTTTGTGDEDSTVQADNAGYYSSSSSEFSNYSFVCPEGWKLYETDSGKRVVIENGDTDGAELESIFISVIAEDNPDALNTEAKIVGAYCSIPSGSKDTKMLTEEQITVDGIESGLTGYNYETSLKNDSDTTGNQGDGALYACTDYFTVIKRDGYFYCIKYIGLNSEQAASGKTFRDFLGTFNFANKEKAVKEKDSNSSVNILILGDDSGMGREGGRVSGRTDIIVLLHLNLETGKGTAVTIPRDTWVNIPGHGEGKINGAHAMGGNDLTIQVIEQLSGLKIDHYIITDFDGFIPLIDFLGGVTVEIGEDLNDGFSGCYLTKGVHHLDGTQALALARDRHRAGDGTTQGGAFAREREAAKIVVGLLDQKSTFEKIMALPFFINYLLNYTWTDLGITDVVRFLPVLGKIKTDDIEVTGIPSWPQAVGNASAVVYDVEATAELFEEVKNQ
jgi:LCP family protein required for cell wall assembly